MKSADGEHGRDREDWFQAERELRQFAYMMWSRGSWRRKVRMLPLESLVARIRGEYSEMPGLRLTFAQACRLWQVDAPTCETLLEQLVSEAFLVQD